MRLDASVVVWIPDGATTSTDQSRVSLPTEVPLEDAVFNLGRVATLIAALAAGDPSALRLATQDRLHQPTRLAATPVCAAAIDAALGAGAWAAWLSGSGPTVAVLCDPAVAELVAAEMPAEGHTKVLAIDTDGAVVLPAADPA
jgi:homoserine kinase